MLPSVERYASAGRYYESDRNPSDYDGIDDTLSCTKHGDTIDLYSIFRKKIMTVPTSYNSGHTASLRFAPIRQSRTSYVRNTLSEIRLKVGRI